jgi:ABC-2 type transport system permease protein
MTLAMNIFLQEFKMHLRSVIAWSLAVAILISIFVSLFSSFADQAKLMNEMLAKFPPQLLLAFGLNGVDLSTVLGYFGYVFLFVQICLAIQAANYGFSLVSIEEREWTADFLLAKPVARTRILTSKILAAVCGLTITNIVIWISSFVSINFFKGDRPYEASTLVLLLLSIVLFQLFFLSIGLLVSLLVKRIRSVTPYSMALGFGMYVLSIFGDMLGESTLEKITPFKHFEPNHLIQFGTFDLPLVLLSVSVIVISLGASYLLYTGRDIPAIV